MMGGMEDVTLDLLRYSWQEELIMLVRVLVGALVGAVVGLERRYSGKSAGLRTLGLVGAGSAAFTVVSIYGFEGQDQARVAAQVVSGIGFLGGGAILRHRGDVRGLTTAAAIWVAAALGLAAGAGLYVVAVGGAVLATAVMLLLPHDIGVQTERSEEDDGDD